MSSGTLPLRRRLRQQTTQATANTPPTSTAVLLPFLHVGGAISLHPDLFARPRDPPDALCDASRASATAKNT